ncbi:unnamed protein product [Ostreobium quekettii]|uniref:Thioredoxin domain-containing protein n=1 Tax=Ostreobium quekettii TaxID=121088 RepID=A0A8S1J261_9CHLO|nr:unnamed protein product [Ostreobium quekettii]
MAILNTHAFPVVRAGPSRFLAGFYVANFLVMASYLLARHHFILHGERKYSRLTGPKELYDWEKQAWGLFAVAMVVKYPRSASLDGFFSAMFLYAKAVIGLMTWMFDVRMFWCYIILFVTLFLMLPQPVYEGPDKIEYLMPYMLNDLTSSKDSVTWLVEFFAHWSPTCVHLEPVMADLSLKYGTEKLRFAKFDLARWPGQAKRFRINMAGASPQLPTLIMFEGGQEVGRIPHVYSDGSVAKGRYGRGDIIKGFELDSRYTRTKAEEAKKRVNGKEQGDAEGSKKEK